MKSMKFFCVMLALMTLAACSGGGYSSEPRPDISRNYALRAMSFSTIPDIAVSEDGGFYPSADIVWRGDPVGPRVPQIAAMFETAVTRNKSILTGQQPIVVDIQLVRFHGVTEQTRYSVGGVYNIVFNMTVRDAASGAILEPTRRIVANLDAPGGSEAVRLERSGQTEKVRVTSFLSSVLRTELL